MQRQYTDTCIEIPERLHGKPPHERLLQLGRDLKHRLERTGWLIQRRGMRPLRANNESLRALPVASFETS